MALESGTYDADDSDGWVRLTWLVGAGLRGGFCVVPPDVGVYLARESGAIAAGSLPKGPSSPWGWHLA